MLNFIKHSTRSRAAIIASLAFGSSIAGAQTVINPGNMASEGFLFMTSSTASAGMVSGPATPPYGTGSANLNVGSDGDAAAQLRTTVYNGVRLADIDSLSYWAYTEDVMTGQTPYLLLNIDLDGVGSTIEEFLFFEPEYQHGYTFPNDQGNNLSDTWQLWDARNGGWWGAFGVAGSGGPGTGVKSLDDFIAANPNAALATTAAGALRMVAGFGAGAWDNHVGYVDGLSIGIDGVVETYDFEAVPEPTSITALGLGLAAILRRRKRA